MNSLPRSPCYLNGDYTVVAEAKVSVLDRGFIFGDGIYEVLPVYGGKPFRFAQHMARLERSLAELRIANPHTRDEWLAIATKLVAEYRLFTLAPEGFNSKSAENGDHLIYIQVTRGVALRDHVMPEHIAPTVFAMISTMKPASDTQRSGGVACVSAHDFRWEKAHIKTVSLLGAVFARQLSFDAGAVETVMFRGEYLSEAAASNVWLVKNGALLAPPKDNLVLEGIRYGLVEEICAAKGIPFALRRITRAEVLAADELLLTSATKEVLAITTLDGAPVGSGKPGPVYAALYAGYQEAKLCA